MQGYDSVAVEADVELGGTDQSLTCCGTRFATTFWSEASVWSTDADFAGKRWSAENVEVPQLCRSSRRPANDVFQAGEDSDHLLEKYFELLTDLSLFELPEQPRDRQKSAWILLPSTTVRKQQSLLSKQRCHYYAGR